VGEDVVGFDHVGALRKRENLQLWPRKPGGKITAIQKGNTKSQPRTEEIAPFVSTVPDRRGEDPGGSGLI